jgi:hypothetical protein
MRQVYNRIQIAVLALITAACGYVEAGSWEDDPENWDRAFGGSTPAGVHVTHSLYKRYPHFTHEHELYFELQADREFVDGLISRFQLTKASEDSSRELDRGGASVPSWFLPEPMNRYDIWIRTRMPGEMRLFVDKSTGAVHLTHSQL